jgi:hypothetical protein
MADKPKPPITTLEAQWLKYRNQTYPEGISEIQNKECRKAFFAGAFSFYSSQMELTASNFSDSESEAELKKLVAEMTAVFLSVVYQKQQRN